MEMQNRTLYFGDNLEILREKFPGSEGYFDLIYLDPPFNSNRNYNVIFKEGRIDANAQTHAFEDSWHWGEDAQKTFEYLVTKTNEDISNLMQALVKIIGHNDVMAYLTMMTIRMIELHRVLKPTGSIYLHCDPTASHYLKIVLDVIFGKKNFRNEIVWCYKSRPVSRKYFCKKHDIILFYSKTDKYYFDWEANLQPLSESTIKKYKHEDEKGKYRLSGRGITGSPIASAKDVDPKWEKERPELVVRDYLKEGYPAEDYWFIDQLNQASRERLGYPTQKPEALLERIIKASSKEGDWVLDPFCGCGTTVSVAERLKRNWVGIDVSTLSIKVIAKRLSEQFSSKSLKQKIHVDGLPKDLNGAKALFDKSPWDFEYWALLLVEGAMPSKNKSKENMKGADKGIDGVITFLKDPIKHEYGKIIIQVKGGKVQRNQIATLKGDVDREGADGGLFISLEEATGPMKEEAYLSGSFKISHYMGEFNKIQILTVKDLLAGKKPDLPHAFVNPVFKKAEEVNADQAGLF